MKGSEKLLTTLKSLRESEIFHRDEDVINHSKYAAYCRFDVVEMQSQVCAREGGWGCLMTHMSHDMLMDAVQQEDRRQERDMWCCASSLTSMTHA